MNFNISFNDGIEATIGEEESFDAIVSVYIHTMDSYLNIYSGSEVDIDFNNALSIGNTSVIFNEIDNRLGGALTA